MKKIFSPLVIVGAMYIEWMLELATAQFINISLPLTAIALFYEYWEMKMPQRLFYAMLFGGVNDILSPFPFGTATGIFLGVAFLMELLQFVFSNVTSLLTKGVGIGLSLFFYQILLLPFATILGVTQQHIVPWNNALFQHAILGGVLWGIVAPFFILTPQHFLRKYFL